MSKIAATIRDIALILGISKSTVSRALNDHFDVKPETARKVRELAAQIDYHPNLLAQHLKQKRTNTIGVVIPETVNRFFAKAIGGIQEVANKAAVEAPDWSQIGRFLRLGVPAGLSYLVEVTSFTL